MSSPMMQQFEAAKARCPGAIVLFRMGDFYELFGDDAREAAELLDLTLTSRDKGPDALPMAGFPFHQLDNQLVKLVAAGRHVAICEQIDDPKTTKGLLRREVTRIITPGLAADETLLEPQRMNFLVAVRLSRSSGQAVTRGENPTRAEPASGIAWIDVAAGRMEAATVDGPDPASQIAEFLMRLDPAECLCGEGERAAVAEIVRASGCRTAVTARPDWWFSDRDSQEAIGRAIQGTSTEGLGFELPRDLPALAAAGGVVLYLEENEPSAVSRLGSFHPWRSSHAMEIDESTRRGLELLRTSGEGRREGSLLGVLDRTRTPMGARLLSRWIIAPLVDAARIADRLDAVGAFVRHPALAESLAAALAGIGDMERITGRIVSGRAGPRDLERIGRVAATLPEILEILSPERLREEGAGLLASLRQRLDPCRDIRERIDAILDGSLHGGTGCPSHTREGGYIRAGYDQRLDELREMASGGKEWIARYQAEQIERTGIASLKVGFNRVFGYFLEIGRTHADKVPPDYVRKQTVKNAERYTTGELEDRQRQVLGSEEEAVRREAELFEGLRSFIAGEHKRLDRVADVLATLDVLVSLAEVARSRGWCRPEITERKELVLEDGRHPVLEELLPAGRLVPNDLELSADSPDSPQLLLVTGPNMGGKSTFIRQAAIAAVMAQAGSWVPARRARIGIVDRLFARIGAGDDLARGSSTFLVEMSQAARILNRATSRSLVILDEVGRGTSTFDGLAIAQAVVEHIHDCLGCRTLFATHYLQLAALERLPGVRNVQVLVERHGDSLVFLHRVAAGAADRSWGIHVAKLAGVPPAVIDRATGLLASFEADPPPPRPASRKPKPQPNSEDGQLPLFSP